MLSEEQRYEEIDLPFYRAEIAPVLPGEVLDFHTHVWKPSDLRQARERGGQSYMVTEADYDVDRLLADGTRLFPDRRYSAVCFGNPTPAADTTRTNATAAEAGRRDGLYPLMVAGRDMLPEDELRRQVVDGEFHGFKVYLNWLGDDYGSVRVADLIGPGEMQVADELRLVVMLHVPGSMRLADRGIQNEVGALAAGYPNASIVIAHCGRAYLPDQMKKSIGAIEDLPNVYVDTSMVMDPTVLQIVFENIDHRRVLFGTDLPVAAMRGRRVYVMDHWVDVVLGGYPASAYRVASDGIRATFMAWEIVLAIRRAGEMAGLSAQQIADVFHSNGVELLNRVQKVS